MDKREKKTGKKYPQVKNSLAVSANPGGNLLEWEMDD